LFSVDRREIPLWPQVRSDRTTRNGYLLRKKTMFRAGKLTVAITALLALTGGFLGVSAAAASPPQAASTGENYVIGTDTTFAPFE
jgi:hypothetical protein